MIWLLKIVNGLKGNVLITEKEVVLFGTNSRITKPFFFLFPLFDEPFFPGYKTFFKIKLFFPLIWKALTICCLHTIMTRVGTRSRKIQGTESTIN